MKNKKNQHFFLCRKVQLLKHNQPFQILENIYSFFSSPAKRNFPKSLSYWLLGHWVIKKLTKQKRDVRTEPAWRGVLLYDAKMLRIFGQSDQPF